MFKKYQITFSQALKEAWLRVKKEAIKIEFSLTSGNEITYRKRLLDRYNAFKITLFVMRTELIDGGNNFNLNGRYESWMQ